MSFFKKKFTGILVWNLVDLRLVFLVGIYDQN